MWIPSFSRFADFRICVALLAIRPSRCRGHSQTPVCDGQGSASGLTAWRSTFVELLDTNINTVAAKRSLRGSVGELWSRSERADFVRVLTFKAPAMSVAIQTASSLFVLTCNAQRPPVSTWRGPCRHALRLRCVRARPNWCLGLSFHVGDEGLRTYSPHGHVESARL